MGCHVGHMSYAAFCYAGDLLLLSHSIHGIEMLVKTSEYFASEYGVTFNAKKTECICFGKNACPLQRQVNVSGQRVKWKDKVKYLGNTLTKDMCADADIRVKRGGLHYIGSVNRLNGTISRCSWSNRDLFVADVLYWLVWLINANQVKGMNIEWKKAERRTLKANI